MNLIDIHDDLCTNFRSWEIGHDTATKAEELTEFLIMRHQEHDQEDIRRLAYEWVGVDL